MGQPLHDVNNALSTGYAFAHFKDRCRQLIVDHELTQLGDVGGGRLPMFSPPEIEELGVRYVLLDASQAELDFAPVNYQKVCADICDPRLEAGYDLLFTKMLAEHVKDGAAMHRNILRLLVPGGMAFHFFPTLYHPAFLVNRVVPERLGRAAVAGLRQGPAKEFIKFPAYYSHCYGPTPRSHRFFTNLGYEVLEYQPFYGSSYLGRIPLLREVEDAFARACAKWQSGTFTAFAWLLLRKPRQA